jgi:uncharacterized protein with PIN domain
MKFIADHMLGTLAKWLRFLGFDTLYPDVQTDPELIKLAKKDNRVLLTRDKNLAHTKGVDTLYIGSVELDEQLIQVISTFDLRIAEAFSRCGLCNSILIEVEKESAKGKIPQKVFDRQDEFWLCQKCHKYYWQGTHFKGIKEKIEMLERKASAA